MRVLRFAVLCVGLALGACQTAIVEETGPLLIRSVSVNEASSFTPTTDVAGRVRRGLNTTLVGRDAGGTPSHVDVTLTRITYKNALVSVIGGSSNGVTSTVTIRDENGATLAQFPHKTVRDAAFTGVIGAAQAVLQDRANVDERLASDHVDGLETRIFGNSTPRRAAPAAPPSGEPAPGTPVS